MAGEIPAELCYLKTSEAEFYSETVRIVSFSQSIRQCLKLDLMEAFPQLRLLPLITLACVKLTENQPIQMDKISITGRNLSGFCFVSLLCARVCLNKVLLEYIHAYL